LRDGKDNVSVAEDLEGLEGRRSTVVGPISVLGRPPVAATACYDAAEVVGVQCGRGRGRRGAMLASIRATKLRVKCIV
jgi:hypothetical protein